MNSMPRILFHFLLAVSLSAGPAAAASDTFPTEELLQGFHKTVFGLEYRAWSWRPYLVKKYTVPVRFYVHNLSRKNRKTKVNAFIRSLGRKIHGLKTDFARSADSANFQIYVVDRAQYREVVQKDVYKNAKIDPPGRCLVRVVSGSRGIKRSAAVIVSDEGEFLFHRCLVEEVLQGLGPMNDDDTLIHSVFNDRSHHSRFTAFDQILMNMLYDSRIKPGMSTTQLKNILPLVARDARRRVN